MKIRVGFSRTNSIISQIIMWFINGEVSHSYIRLYDEFLGVWLVAHSDWFGVEIITAERFESENILVEEFEIDDERVCEGLKKSLRHLGKKYDYWKLLSWASLIIFKRWFKRKVKNPLADPKRLICVDWIISVLNDSGITHLPYGELEPKSLRVWFNENYENFEWKKL